MKRRAYRLIFFTLPATVLLLWLAAGRYNDNLLRDHREAAVQVARALAISAHLYAEEHHDRLPPADGWEEALKPYLGTVPLTLSPEGGSHGRRCAMNRAAAGHKLSELGSAASVILFYESTSARPDATDDFDSMVPADDPNPLVLVYADGHIDNSIPASKRDLVIQRSRDTINSADSKQY